MKFMLFAVLTLTINAQAESFKISGKLYDFQLKEGVLVRGCEKDCKALKTIRSHKSIDLKKIREGLQFVNSVGSDVCLQVYKAGSVIGRAENQDGRAFCVFDDKSMVEMNSLSDYLANKKIVK